DGCDRCEARERLRAADRVVATLAALLEGWAELPGGRGVGLTVAEALRFLNDPNHADEFQTLRGALMEWSRTDRLPGAGIIGRKLRDYRGRVVNGMALHGESAGQGVQRGKAIRGEESGGRWGWGGMVGGVATGVPKKQRGSV